MQPTQHKSLWTILWYNDRIVVVQHKRSHQIIQKKEKVATLRRRTTPVLLMLKGLLAHNMLERVLTSPTGPQPLYKIKKRLKEREIHIPLCPSSILQQIRLTFWKKGQLKWLRLFIHLSNCMCTFISWCPNSQPLLVIDAFTSRAVRSL